MGEAARNNFDGSKWEAPHLVTREEEVLSLGEAREKKRQRDAELEEITRTLETGSYYSSVNTPTGEQIDPNFEPTASLIFDRREASREFSDDHALSDAHKVPEGYTVDKQKIDRLIERGKVVGSTFDFLGLNPGEGVTGHTVSAWGGEWIYTKDDVIGSGGFGTVFAGHPVLKTELSYIGHDEFESVVGLNVHGDLTEPIVIKVIPHKESDKFISALKGEIAALDHVSILRAVKEFSGSQEHDKSTVIVMERAEGRDLGTVCKENREFFRKTEGSYVLAESMLAVLKDLDRLHSVGAVHGDIKPSNLMVRISDPSQSRLIDYGLARKSEQREDDRFYGTPMFMTYGAIKNDADSFMYSDVSAVAKSFGIKFDGGSLLKKSVAGKVSISLTMQSVGQGKMFLGPDLGNPEEKARYLAGFQFSAEREFAELIYDIALPKHNYDQMKKAKNDGKLLDTRSAVERLEKIVDAMNLIVSARRVVEIARRGEKTSVTAQQYEDIARELNVDPDIEKLRTILKDVSSIVKEKPASRSERARMLGVEYDVVREMWDRDRSNAVESDVSGSADSTKRIDEMLESARLSLTNGDLDLAYRQIDDAHKSINELLMLIDQQKSAIVNALKHVPGLQEGSDDDKPFSGTAVL